VNSEGNAYYAFVVSSLVFVFIKSNCLKKKFSFALPTIVAVGSVFFFFSFVPLECFFDHCFLSGAVTDSISVLPHRYCFLTNNPKMPLKTFDMSAFAFLLFKLPVFGYFLKLLPHLFPKIIGFACD